MATFIREIENGTPCEQCKENCAGFEAHYWRKTCQLCKCPREAHAIYQDQRTTIHDRLGLKNEVISSGIDPQQLGYTWVPPGVMTSHNVQRYFDEIPSTKVPKIGTSGERHRERQITFQLPKQDLSLEYCKHIDPQQRASYEDFVAARNEIALDIGYIKDVTHLSKCASCDNWLEKGNLAVVAPKLGDTVLWHPKCFTCASCEELLVDLTYCVHEDQIYCERHYAELLKPRCNACDETNQAKSYCDENVVMGGVEDSLLSRLSSEKRILKKSTYTTERTTLWSEQYTKQETDTEIVEIVSRNIENEEPSVKSITTDFLNNERAEHVTLKGLSDFYDFNASIDINKSVSGRKPRPEKFHLSSEVSRKPLDFEHTLKDLSDFLDYNVKMHRAGLGLPFPSNISKEVATPTDETIHSAYTSRKSSVNLPSHNITPMNCLSPSPSNLMFYPEDQRDIEYLRRKYQESSVYQSTYDRMPSEEIHRGTGSSEELSRFQRSRSQSRSMGDILAVDGLKLPRPAKRGSNTQVINQNQDFISKEGSNPDHIHLNNLEEEEYHHFRRYSLCQECQVEEYPEDDDYICIRKIEVRQLSPYEIQLSFNDYPSEASSVCATPLPEDEASPMRDYHLIPEDEFDFKPDNDAEKTRDRSVNFSRPVSEEKIEYTVDGQRNSSFNDQGNTDGSTSDQYAESNEEESYSSGYSQRGYVSSNQKLEEINVDESHEDTNKWDPNKLLNVIESVGRSPTPLRSPKSDRSVSPALGFEAEEDLVSKKLGSSVSPNTVDRRSISREAEDILPQEIAAASPQEIQVSYEDNIQYFETTKNKKKNKRNKKKDQKLQEDTYSSQYAFKPDQEPIRQVESPVQNFEKKSTASPSPNPETSNNTFQRNMPSSTSSNTQPDSITNPSDPSNRGRNNSLGNYELIKDGSMYPWF